MCRVVDIDAFDQFADTCKLGAIYRLDQIRVIGHLLFEELHESKHDRIGIAIFGTTANCVFCGQQHLTVCQHCKAHVTVEFGMRLEKCSVEPDALGVANRRYLAVVLLRI